MENFNQQLIDTPQDITGSWQPVGDWFNIDTYPSIFFEPAITQNDSSGIKFRLFISFNGSGSQLTKKIITTNSIDLIIPSEQKVFEPINGKTNLTFKIPDGANECRIEVMADVVGATPAQITSALVARNYEYDNSEKIEITTIRVDTANIKSPIALNASTSVKILDANPNRNQVWVSNRGLTSEIWVKPQPASVDNDKKGILIAKNKMEPLFPDKVYTGEISAIAEVNNPIINVVEI